MHRSVAFFGFVALLAALGPSPPVMAQGELPAASSTDADPTLFPEDVTTTTSEGNPDGSRTVTTTDAEGNVLEEHTVPSEAQAAADAAEAAINEAVDAADAASDAALGAAEGAADDASGALGTRPSPSAVPPPTTPFEEASDALLDTEEQIRDLRFRHRELLDQAGRAEGEEFDDLVEQARKISEELEALEDKLTNQRIAVGGLMKEDVEYIDMNAMRAEIEALGERLDALPEEIHHAETDEEAEALEEEARDARVRLDELQDELDRIDQETRDSAIQRAEERRLRDSARQGALQRPQTPNTSQRPPQMQRPVERMNRSNR